jgi:hypothetical protein
MVSGCTDDGIGDIKYCNEDLAWSRRVRAEASPDPFINLAGFSGAVGSASTRWKG